MNPRYRVTALAFLSLSAGTLWVNPARADTTAPFKVDPRLLGLPALEEAAPDFKIAKPPKPSAPPITESTAQPAAQTTELQAPPPSTLKPLPAAVPVEPSAPPPTTTTVEKAAPVPAEATPKPNKASAPEPSTTPAPMVQAPAKPEPITAPTPTVISAEPPALPPAQIEGIPLRLQPTLALTPHPSQADEKTPLFISAMRVQGKADTYVEAEEDVELRKRGLLVNADTLRYDETQETVDAKGKVRLQTDTGVIKGPDLHYKLPDSTGFMNTPAYALGGKVAGQGVAEKLNFAGEDLYQLEKAKYSTCGIGQEAWWIHASQLELDRSTNVGTGRNAWIEFKGVPILYTPYINFSLNNERETGFLSPAFGTSNTRGIEFAAPFYWNIAPNYDATFTPREMTKRGLQLGAEFRYLQPNYSGIISGEVLPNDNATKTTRSEVHITHSQNFGAGFSGNVDFQEVSDNNYYRDLSALVAATSQTTLPHQASLSYGNGPFSAGLLYQRFQILQDPITPIPDPYERVPQITASYRKLNAFGFADVLASSEFVKFSHPTSVTGSRFTLNPTFSVPLTKAYGYITPKLGLHYTQYTLDQTQNPAHLPNTTRSLPVFSLDSGLTFERESSLFGQALTQTLEPRIYYLYVPYKNQDQIPLFDTAESDFSFAQVFSENRFSGGDRISDANQATFALTSRFIESSTGLERLRASVGQRYFFSTPKVTISPTTPPPTDNASDFLVSIGGQISPAWSADAALQYNPNLGQSEKYNVGTRYNPEPGKLANFNYRFTRNSLHQVDFSGQWPVAQHWQLLGRWNYSIQDRKSVEVLGGFEYKQSCWALRVVAHRFQTATQTTSNALFLQLELSGLSSLGTNPFNTLKQNIGGYTQTKPRPEEINLNEF